MTIPSLDDTDHGLIGLLRDDARLSVVAPARKRRVARATVQDRIARLEKNGTLVGYAVRLRPKVETRRIRAIGNIAAGANGAAEIRRELSGHSDVITSCGTHGRRDRVTERRADSLDAFDKAFNAIRMSDGLATTGIGILLSWYQLEATRGC